MTKHAKWTVGTLFPSNFTLLLLENTFSHHLPLPQVSSINPLLCLEEIEVCSDKMKREQCVVCPEETKERLKWVDLGEFALQKVVTAQSMGYLKECHALPSHHQTFNSSVPMPIYSAIMSASAQGHFLHLGTRFPHFSPSQALCFYNYLSFLWTESFSSI